jgi:hypothetical protein
VKSGAAYRGLEVARGRHREVVSRSDKVEAPSVNVAWPHRLPQSRFKSSLESGTRTNAESDL